MKRRTHKFLSPAKVIVLAVVMLVSFDSTAQVPGITSFSPTSGSVGMTVTITGSNFDPIPTNNIVYFGGIRATVSAASATELITEVPVGASSDYIYVNTNGLIAQSGNRFLITFESDGTISKTPNSFADVETYTTGDGAWALDLGDLDGDGLLDVVTGNWDDESYSVFVNNSSGHGDISFATKVDFASNAYVNEVKLKDLDGDGLLDIVAVTENDGGDTYLELLRNTTSAPGSVSFTLDANIPLDGYNYVLEATDFNGDGKLDVVVLDIDNAVVSVFENSSTVGSISFEDDVDFAIGSDSYDVDYGDINADGLPDIVTLDGTTQTFSVLENTSSAGSITFDPKVDFAVNATINCLEVGDLNADGLPDVVVKNDNSIKIFKNESSATTLAMASPENIGVTTQFGFGLSLDGDFDGDGKPDILFKSTLSQIGILKNTGSETDISFANEVLYSTGSSQHSRMLTSGDLDLDGEPDIIVTTSGFTSGFQLDVLRNKHSSTDFIAFSFAEQVETATIDAEAHTIEVTVEGVLDLTDLVATFELSKDATATVAGDPQTSESTSNDFSNPVTYAVTAEDGSTTQDWTVTVILECVLDETDLTEEVCGSYDFDGQIIKTSGTYVREYTNVLGCDSTVTVDLTVHPVEFYENVYAVNSYAFDGETLTASGRYEYGPFTSTESGCDSTFLLNLTIEPDIYDNQDYIQFRMNTTDFPILTELGRSYTEDVNGDGEKDVFFIGKTENDIIASLFINNADGTYTEKTDHGIQGLKVGGRNSLFLDADGDDNLDFLVIGRKNNSNFTKLYINNGQGVFLEKTDHGLPGLGLNVYTSYLDSADVDGDNDIDLVISKTDPYNSHAPELWLNNGDGSFVLSTANDFHSTDASGASFADFDGDGDQDLVLSGYGLENRIWLNDGTGLFAPKLDKSLASLWYHGLVIFDMDGDGDLDIYDSSTKDYSNQYTSVYFNNGDGTFIHDESSKIPRLEGNLAGYGTNSKAADFDNDGDIDLIIEGQYRYAGGPPMVDYLDVWLNNGFGHFKPLRTQSLNIPYSDDDYPLLAEYGYSNYTYINALSVFDFDRDGRLDILLSGTEIWDPNDEVAYDEVTRIFNNSSVSNDLEIESCDIYDFDGTTLTASGNYQGMYTDDYGSTYPVNLSLTILEPTTSEETVEACESYEWNDVNYTATGTYQAMFLNAAGCDSTATLNLTIVMQDEESVDVTTCDEYEFDGDLITSSGSYTATFVNKTGCDSLVALSLTILESDIETIEEVACGSYFFDGEDLTSSGDYSATFTNQAGCDSLVNLNLTINQVYNEEVEVASCAGYEFDGDWLTESGQFSAALLSTHGCDSLVNLDLTILEPDEVAVSEASCGSYFFDGEDITAIGDYQATFTNQAGCDSLVALSLTILEPDEVDVGEVACGSYFFNGVDLTSSGDYNAIFTNEAGCDSLVNLSLKIDPIHDETVDMTVCTGYEFDGNWLSGSGQFSATLTSTEGCDSLVNLNLTVLESHSIDTSIDACGSYEFGAQVLDESGVYEELFTNQAGCDSLVTLTFGHLPEPTATIEMNGVVLFATDKNATGYQWYDCDTNEPLDGETKRQLTPPRSGSYYVEVSNATCTVTSDCLSLDWVVSVPEVLDQKAMDVYPTVNTGKLTIDLGSSYDLVDVSIVSLEGKVVHQQRLEKINKQDIRFTIPKGIYLVYVNSGQQNLINKKIVKID